MNRTISSQDIAVTVATVIGETFFIDPSLVTRSTRAVDVDGWDSLSHTVLMIRLEKRLGFSISDRIAAKATDVGELIDLLCVEASGYQP